jgi:hypothetical protein
VRGIFELVVAEGISDAPAALPHAAALNLESLLVLAGAEVPVAQSPPVVDHSILDLGVELVEYIGEAVLFSRCRDLPDGPIICALEDKLGAGSASTPGRGRADTDAVT